MIAHLTGMVEHHVTNNFQTLPTGVHVIAYIGYAIGFKVVLDGCDNGVLYFSWYPTINTVTDDIVKLTNVFINIGDALTK